MNAHRKLAWVLIAKAAAGAVLTFGVLVGYWLRTHGLSLGDAVTELRRGDEPRFAWSCVDKRHWQAAVAGASEGEAPEVTEAREQTGAGCAVGMVRVKGNYRLESQGADATGEIERIQDAACTDWISRDFPARCRTFDQEKIARDVAKLPTRAMDYCIDRFEYPNVAGKNPMIVVTFHEAEALCKAGKKRLCTESEWTFACEGEEVLPYPYGGTRDATACVMDRAWRPFSETGLQPRDGDGARAELDRLWQAEPSGSRAGCKSPFGVYDLTGNVDEWTRSVRTGGYASILKGGYWGPVRARCRPATRAHNEDFVAYQQSFRCCGEADTQIAARPPQSRPKADPTPAPATSAAPAGAAERPVADRMPEWRTGGDDDELDAITRARVGLGCASAPGSPGGAAALGGLGVALALVVRRRRSAQEPVREVGPPRFLDRGASRRRGRP